MDFLKIRINARLRKQIIIPEIDTAIVHPPKTRFLYV